MGERNGFWRFCPDTTLTCSRGLRPRLTRARVRDCGFKYMKIALVHDYLREYGGAERVLETLHEMWPDAPVYTSFYDWQAMGKHAERFRGWDIRPSWVQKYWLIQKWISPLRFLAPKIWESFDLSEYDVVITSSGWFMCRGVRVGRKAVHICYIHHPPRNLYGYPTGSMYQKYLIVRIYASIINFFMRHYDYETAQRVDYFIANSKETARRVAKFYRRESVVIYPPVEVKSKQKTENSKVKKSLDIKYYFLSVGRLAWSKQTDIIIRAANMLKLPLKIVGTGPEEKHLREIAGETVEFLGGVSDEQLTELYFGAKATIFAALDEDFGIVPVESMASGTPVIGLSQGGVIETVVDGKTGILFREPTVKSLVEAIEKFNRSYEFYKTNKTYTDCIKQAEKFSKERFVKEMYAFVNKNMKTGFPLPRE